MIVTYTYYCYKYQLFLITEKAEFFSKNCFNYLSFDEQLKDIGKWSLISNVRNFCIICISGKTR